MSTAAAVRQRARRQRLANGKILLLVEADETKLVELLVASKLIDPMVDHGRSEIERATGKLLELIADA
jgi:hypothetical protein